MLISVDYAWLISEVAPMDKTADEDLVRRVTDCAITVHERVGPGLTKDAYKKCLAIELMMADLAFEYGRVLPMTYKGHTLDFRCRTDFIVADGLVLLVEAEEQLDFTHEALLRTCVWMGGFPLGLLLNFNVVDMAAEGITRVTCLRAENSPEDDVFGDVFDDPELSSRTG
jgi:GxxExxY protein